MRLPICHVRIFSISPVLCIDVCVFKFSSWMHGTVCAEMCVCVSSDSLVLAVAVCVSSDLPIVSRQMSLPSDSAFVSMQMRVSSHTPLSVVKMCFVFSSSK